MMWIYVIVDAPEEDQIRRIYRKGVESGSEGELEKSSKMQEYVR